MEQELKRRTNERMAGAVEALKKEFSSIRTGRASLALLDGITISYHGVPTPLQQLASLSILDGRRIAIQPWEQGIIPEIEKAIMKSDLGLTPVNDGRIIRLNIPPLTEERRRQLLKVVRKKAEEARTAIRNIRRDVNEKLKRLEKEKHISEDDLKRAQNDLQKITDSYISRIDKILENKEKEIMEV